MTSDQPTTENFKSLLCDALNDQESSIQLDQSRKIRIRATGQENVKLIQMQLRNRLLTKRYVNKVILRTFPYGFSDSVYLNEIESI